MRQGQGTHERAGTTVEAHWREDGGVQGGIESTVGLGHRGGHAGGEWGRARGGAECGGRGRGDGRSVDDVSPEVWFILSRPRPCARKLLFSAYKRAIDIDVIDMWLPKAALRILGLSVQQPFSASPPPPTMSSEFALKASLDVLSPQDMLSLPRPGAPLPNPAGDLALIPVSTYSFDDRK